MDQIKLAMAKIMPIKTRNMLTQVAEVDYYKILKRHKEHSVIIIILNYLKETVPSSTTSTITINMAKKKKRPIK
jgi:hypothetical protein